MNKFVEVLLRKASKDSSLMAYCLNHYAVSERLDLTQLLAFLNCSEEQYVKLALCNAPENIFAPNFKERIKHISMFCEIEETTLLIIVKQVRITHNLSNSTSDSEGILLAARSKESDIE